jgi:hypothetical protein
MSKDKSIIAKFTETMKGLADSAAEALKAEESPKGGKRAAAGMPLAAEGLVSDPLLVPPVAVQPVRGRKHMTKTAAARRGRRTVKERSTTSKSKSRNKAKTSKAKTSKASATGRGRAKRPAKKTRRQTRRS